MSTFIINVCWHLLFFHYFLTFMLAPISSPVLTGCWALLSWRLASSSPSTAMIRCRYTEFMYSWLSVLAISCICTFQHILSLLNYATFSGEEFLCLTFSVPQYYVRTLHGRGSPGVTGRVRKIARFRYCWPSYWVWTQDVQDENTQQLEWTSLIPAGKAKLFSTGLVLPSTLLNPPDHQSQQTKWHPISSRSPKLRQTRLLNVKYTVDITRHLKTVQQILILMQSRQAKWSVLWGECN